MVSGESENLSKWFENANGLDDFSVVHDVLVDDFGFFTRIDIAFLDLGNDLVFLCRFGEFDYSVVQGYLNIDNICDFDFTFNSTQPIHRGYCGWRY